MRGLTFTRELPEAGWAGEEGALIYIAQNNTPVPRFFLAINEPLPAWIEPLDPEPPLFNVEAARAAPDEQGSDARHAPGAVSQARRASRSAVSR